jgi:hypothetical protein
VRKEHAHHASFKKMKILQKKIKLDAVLFPPIMSSNLRTDKRKEIEFFDEKKLFCLTPSPHFFVLSKSSAKN